VGRFEGRVDQCNPGDGGYTDGAALDGPGQPAFGDGVRWARWYGQRRDRRLGGDGPAPGALWRANGHVPHRAWLLARAFAVVLYCSRDCGVDFPNLLMAASTFTELS